mmetsp:Transcript_13153/g.45532  ORF Transcript_13153/g.45532 Transcript_13153/m.45532 type:complete len:228 (+) Transcript_13153:465-1148(+)
MAWSARCGNTPASRSARSSRVADRSAAMTCSANSTPRASCALCLSTAAPSHHLAHCGQLLASCGAPGDAPGDALPPWSSDASAAARRQKTRTVAPSLPFASSTRSGDARLIAAASSSGLAQWNSRGFGTKRCASLALSARASRNALSSQCHAHSRRADLFADVVAVLLAHARHWQKSARMSSSKRPSPSGFRGDAGDAASSGDGSTRDSDPRRRAHGRPSRSGVAAP